jgi:hypothetical protein
MNEAATIRLTNESAGRSQIKTRDMDVVVTQNPQDNAELQISAWKGECFLNIQLDTDDSHISGMLTTETRNGTAAWRLITPDKVHEVYKASNGNLEWEIVLPDKPTSGSLEFPILTSGLVYFYQDSICEISGCSRPDSVQNSYAVYHASQWGNITRINESDTLREEYGTGKMLHIYRPRAWDEKGKTVWGRIDIDTIKSILTISIPLDFLNQAVYPIVIDPTFGYSSEPATRLTLSSSYAVLVNTHTASAGDVITSYSAFCADLANDDATGEVIAYSVDGGLPDSRIAEPIPLPSISGAIGQWYETATVSQSMSDNVEYCVAIGNYANGLCCYYDSGSGTGYSRSTTGLADPWNSVGTGSQRFGVYATYTVNGTGVESTRRRSQSARGEK